MQKKGSRHMAPLSSVKETKFFKDTSLYTFTYCLTASQQSI